MSRTRASGTNLRALGINPRALKVNPRNLGVNLRALGVNPRKAAALAVERLEGLKADIKQTVSKHQAEAVVDI